MKVFYIGDAKGPVEAYGTVFEPGKAADVDDSFKDKVKANPFFGDKASAKAPEKGFEIDTTVETFEARLNGSGKYSIYRGQTELVDDLSAKDAEAFNGMSAQEKSEYVDSLD